MGTVSVRYIVAVAVSFYSACTAPGPTRNSVILTKEGSRLIGDICSLEPRSFLQVRQDDTGWRPGATQCRGTQ